ncbi:MAG: hypothetical protein FWD69_10100 [Polyangiaceae bacterium]|nr:hypothetical protein [Polyangiaceae bacterium]
MADPTPVTTATGKVGYLPAGIAREGQGVRAATPAEQQAAQQQANTDVARARLDAYFAEHPIEGAIMPSLEGAARGLTLGLSDKAIVELTRALRGDEGAKLASEGLERWKSYAPIASTISELGGVLGGALAGDEEGLSTLPAMVSRIGAGTERGLAKVLGEGALARAGGALARGAVEGSFYGAGEAISESALKDTDLTGEALIGGASHGALGGMIAGGLMHGLGEGYRAWKAPKVSAEAYDAVAEKAFGEAAPNVGKTMAEEAAGQELANQASPSTLGEIWANRQNLLVARERRLAEQARDLSESITKQQRAQSITQMETFGEAKLKQIENLVDKSNFQEQSLIAKDWLSRAQAEVEPMIGDANSGLTKKSAKRFAGYVSRINDAIDSGDSAKLFDALDTTKRWVGQEAKFGRTAVGLSESGRTFDALYRDSKGLQSALEDTAWGKAGEAQRIVNEATTSNIALGERFQNRFTTRYGSTAGRPDFVGDTGAVHGFIDQLTTPARDLDAQSVRDFLSTRRRFLDATEQAYDHGARGAQAIADERAALDSLEKTFNSATQEASTINQIRRLQAEEHERQFGGLVGVVTDLAVNPISTMKRLAMLEQQAKSVMRKFTGGAREAVGVARAPSPSPSPSSVDSGFFSQLISSAASKGRAQKVGDEVARSSVNSVLGSEDKAKAVGEAARAGGVKTEKFIRDQRGISALQANPQQLSDRVGAALNPVSDAAPKTTTAATATAMRGVAFLASKLPSAKKDPYSLQPQFQPATRASDAEIAQFRRYKEALDDPTIIVRKAVHGGLTPEHVEAVKAVYPRLYDEMRNQVFQALVDSKSPIPYTRRIALGILLDLPTDQTLAPDFVQTIQSTYQRPAAQPPPPSRVSNFRLSVPAASGADGVAQRGQR